MKSSFFEYYNLDEAERSRILREGILIFDASSLLNLYQYSQNTINSLLNVLEGNKERLWLPHQFAKEYHKNRLKEIRVQSKAYESSVQNLENQLGNLISKSCVHPFLDVDDKAFRSINKNVKKIKQQLDQYKKDHPVWFRDDFIMDKITEFYNGKIGKISDIKIEDVLKEGEERGKNKIPPGYMDYKDKKGNDRFGDFIGWKEIINQAQTRGKDVVFIIDDIKEDWWLFDDPHTKRIVCPRPELIKEFKDLANQNIIFYKMDRFLETISGFDLAVITEVKEKGRNLEINLSEQVSVSDSAEFIPILSAEPSEIIDKPEIKEVSFKEPVEEIEPTKMEAEPSVSLTREEEQK
ncbi:TPA: hypothetical protein DCZ15_03090 [Candidatus Falkowbacteria bacterium]|nr:MAG: hypothetical protein UV95_C0002G0004 [Candidatus Falkowbacteria bacterium GW2011_GWF2_43_32]HBA36834.1 hypothetical protein [Candidatus Falkowbacteria bacterium]